MKTNCIRLLGADFYQLVVEGKAQAVGTKQEIKSLASFHHFQDLDLCFEVFNEDVETEMHFGINRNFINLHSPKRENDQWLN